MSLFVTDSRQAQTHPRLVLSRNYATISGLLGNQDQEITGRWVKRLWGLHRILGGGEATGV